MERFERFRAQIQEDDTGSHTVCMDCGEIFYLGREIWGIYDDEQGKSHIACQKCMDGRMDKAIADGRLLQAEDGSFFDPELFPRLAIKHYVKSLKLEIVDAVSVVTAIRKQTGQIIDWHIASSVLDEMHRNLEVTIAGHSRGGMTQYRTI